MTRAALLAIAFACSPGQDAPLVQPCTMEIDACQRDADCRNFSSCVGKCAATDDACPTQCRIELPQGYNEAAVELLRCTSPNLACGGYIANRMECGTCVRAKCCAEVSACQSSPACAALQACERSCHGFDVGCLSECERRYPSAVDASRKAAACLETSCERACVPLTWRCLEDPAPPIVATNANIDLIINTLDYATGGPRSGVRLRACNALDYPCVSPLSDEVTTDALGMGTLQLKNLKDKVLCGYVEMTGENLVPSMWFLGDIKHELAPSILVVDVVTFAVLTGALGTPRDELGHVLLTAVSCTKRNGRGVRFAIDPMGEAIGAYLVDKAPSKDATFTDASGWGGFMNVRPNVGITINATVVDFNLKYPPVTVFTRPGWIARVQVPANPR